VITPQFLRFLAVGVLNTVFGYLCFAGLVYVGVHYSLALLIATLVGVLFNFKTTGSFVFGVTNNYLLVRYLVVYGVVYLLNVVGVKALVGAGISPVIGGAMMLAPAAVFAFVLQKRYVFRK